MIGKRIQNVFDCMAEGKIQQALGELYSAVWATSGALYGMAGEKCCCRFLRERMEIIWATWRGNVSAPGMSVTLRTGDEPILLGNVIFDILIQATQGQDSASQWVKGTV